jgi:long-subunit acyl-CoA synthetase (AMP-forming)
MDSVGRVLPHCSVVVENNEIVVSGASFLGYMNDESSWYPSQVRTGDLGYINDVGNLHIDGRCKNIIITSFGRNISPEWVEAELTAGPVLQQCMVVGDAKPYLTALIASSDSTNDSEINAWIEQVNAKLPDYARVKNWLRFSTTIFSSYTTANGRLLRAAVLAEFSPQIETLYSESLTKVS